MVELVIPSTYAKKRIVPNKVPFFLKRKNKKKKVGIGACQSHDTLQRHLPICAYLWSVTPADLSFSQLSAFSFTLSSRVRQPSS